MEVEKLSQVVKIALPYPPSVNRYWRHPTSGRLAGRHLISAEGRAYRELVKSMVLAQGVEGVKAGRVGVAIALTPPDKRKRDLDNTLKALLDGLTAAGVWDDDSQIDDLHIRRLASQGVANAGAAITITVMEG